MATSEPPSLAVPAAIELRGASIGSVVRSAPAVLESVDWQIRPGDWWVVGGSHWTGKSALLATAGGVQRPLSGSHFLFGVDTQGLDEDRLWEHRSRLGMVFEGGGRLFNHLSIGENIALPLCYHHDCPVEEVAGQVSRLMDVLGLTPHADALPEEVSRNWLQRAGLARALALQPGVLLLDNPLAGLRPAERSWWLDLLSQLHAGHEALGGHPVTLVVSTDDYQPWRERARQFAVVADRHCHILGGRTELDGCPDRTVRELLTVDSLTE